MAHTVWHASMAAGTLRGATGLHHRPRFGIDQTALPLGVELLVRVVERYLRGQ